MEFPEAAFGVSYTPIIEAGGDFYDVFPVGDGAFGYFAADFSGHDIRTSYNTFALKALISQNTGPHIPPQETMQVINRVFTSLMKNGEHLTGVYVRLDRGGSELTVVNAGHLPVLHLCRGRDPALAAEGDILGSSRTSCSSPSACRSGRGSGSSSTRTGCSRSSGRTPRGREEGMDALMAWLRRDERELPIGRAVDEIVSLICPDRGRLQDDVLLLGVEV